MAGEGQGDLRWWCNMMMMMDYSYQAYVLFKIGDSTSSSSLKLSLYSQIYLDKIILFVYHFVLNDLV